MEVTMMAAASPKKAPTEKGPSDVEAYLAALPLEARNALGRLRAAILAAAPGAVEGFSYGAPAIRVGGRPVVCYAAARSHYSLFPMSGEVMRQFAGELGRYDTSKGTIRFSFGASLPTRLVQRIVKARLKELGGKRG
jgi:uncharacterized protein YdhG (YjbR/CyaY superfamily)